MKIDLSRLDDPAWVEWKDGVEILVRPLPVSKTNELRKRATPKKFEFANGVRVPGQPDNDKYNDLLQEWLVKDWRGILDRDGNEVPCTPENIKAILDHFHELRLFVVMAGRDLETYRQQQGKEEEGNSSASHDGC